MRDMVESNIHWLGAVPANWKIVKIKYVLKERVEKNSPIRSRFILSLTAKQGVIPYDQKEGGGNKPKDDVSAYRLAYPGDIVLNSMNILSGSVGLSKYFGCVSPVYYMLRPYEDSFDVRFFNYIFLSTAFQKSLYGLGNGIMIKESNNGKLNTIRMRIPMDKFGGLSIPVAPVEEQRTISDFLDAKCEEIDFLITQVNEQIEVLTKLRESIVYEAVTKGLNPDAALKETDIEWTGKIPAHWKCIPSKYLFIEKNIPKQEGDEMLTSSVKHGIISQDEYRERESFNLVAATKELDKWKHVEPYDYIISLMSFKSGLEMSMTKGCITWHYVTIRAVKEICYGYYKWLFKTCNYILALRGTCNYIRNGQDLRFSNFAKVPLIIPPIDEQKAIAEYLDGKCSEIDQIIDDKSAQLELLDTYKKSLIFEYVTGKKEVPVNG